MSAPFSRTFVANARLTVGLTVLSQADILLAVWDGKLPRGRGGTAEMVAEAARAGGAVIKTDFPAEDKFDFLPEQSAPQGVTVFLTTHYMDEAERVAHRIAIIDRGRIVAQGSPQELKQQTGADSLEQDVVAPEGGLSRRRLAGRPGSPLRI